MSEKESNKCHIGIQMSVPYYVMSKFYYLLMQNIIVILLIILEFEILAEKENETESATQSVITTTSTEKEAQFGETFSKCYDELGCIKTDDQWYHSKFRPVNLKPLNRNIIKTNFLLIRKNRTTLLNRDIFYQVVAATENSVLNAGYKKGIFLFVLIHDFTSSGYAGWIKHISKVLKSRTKKCNIISVDWNDGAQPPYDQAVANARVVALEIIYLLIVLKGKQNLDLNRTHIIGHGIGAHIAGYVGYAFNGTGKITGLDPSGPRFEGMPAIVRLDSSDAKYVEVLHTDAMESNHQGAAELFGHTDFFINNADLQPGCPPVQKAYDLLGVTRGVLSPGEVLPGCSHKRAYKYFIESLELEECTFLGIKCGSYMDFKQGKCTSCGENCRTFGLVSYSKPNTGSYFLQTGPNRPYCLYQYKVTIQIKNDKSKYFGSFGFIQIDKHHYSTTSSTMEPRAFIPGSDNNFVFYAGVPEMRKIIHAKVGWKEQSQAFCLINCKQSIHVEKVTIKSINSNTKSSQAVQLCPKDNAEIQNGDYVDFLKCK